MLIRVGFGDNDFCIPIRDACEAVVEDISRGYSGEECIELFKKHIAEHGIDNIRQRIVVSATGFCLARNGARGRFKGYAELSATDIGYVELDTTDVLGTYHKTLKYLDDIIEIKIVRHYDKYDDDCGSCYIDLYQNKVVEC